MFFWLLLQQISPHVTHFSRINESNNTLQLFALRKCNAGEQCFMSYGSLNNSDLLTFYGFVIDKNPYDFIPIGEFQILSLQKRCRHTKAVGF